jgi:hypothetical protein
MKKLSFKIINNYLIFLIIYNYIDDYTLSENKVNYFYNKIVLSIFRFRNILQIF